MRQCRLIRNLTFLFVASGLLTSGAMAGQIDPGLAATMRASGPDDFLSVVIRPIGTLVGAELKKQVTTRYAARADQHRAAVEALQATAAYAQRPVLAAINSPQYQGRILDAEGFWIDNIITARMTPSAIAELAQRADVDEIVLMPKIELVRPIEGDATSVANPEAVENGLRAIRVDSAWEMGYTGSGRVVASLDTGVDGKHALLASKWRGNNGYPYQQCWFNPAYGDTVPRYFAGDVTCHGTEVMGIMVGGTFAGHTFGVCPDCQWITAAAIDVPCPTAPTAICSNLIEALQWVADPDGDPLTSDDVPDAVANPWGALTVGLDAENNCVETGVGCANAFWNVIDNIEAAGAVMVFAAGNEGDCGASTIRNPANRVTSDVNAFSVGMVSTLSEVDDPPVDLLSSLGPSDCDNISVKPELAAPGVGIFTTLPNNAVGAGSGSCYVYGTSFATPHVAAAVAILREYNPNATVDQIKHAMLSSARDLGPSGPDNAYGHGLLNVVGALRALPANTQPALAVKKTYYTLPAPGQSVDIALLLRNSGTAATGVQATLVSNDARLTVIDGSATFPDMPTLGDTVNNSADVFRVTVAPDVVAGERLAVTLTITAAGGYTHTQHAAIQTGPEQSPDLYTHDAGNVKLTISDFGGFGLQADNLNPRKGAEGFGAGFLYPKDDLTPSLFEGAFMVGVGPTQVSDAARNSSGAPDVDFRVDPGGRIQISEPGAKYAEETRAAFSDEYAENPIGLYVEQRTWESSEAGEDNYVVCEYTIHNRSGHTLTSVRAGLFFDWDFPFAGDLVATRDSGNYNAQFGVGWMRDAEAGRYRGLAVISPEGTAAYRYFDNPYELYTPWASTTGPEECIECDGFTDAEKWAAMTSGFTRPVAVAAEDGSHLIATGPLTIQADSAVRVAFAIIGATSQDELFTTAQTARSNYNAGTVTFAPTSFAFSAPVGGPDPAAQSLRISNNTDEAVRYEVTESASFVSVDPDSGGVASSSFVDLSLQATVGDRTGGTYRDTIAITTSDPLASLVRVPLTLTVGSGTQVSVNPNPFNPKAANGTVTLSLRKAATNKTSARIYDLGGRLVKDLGDVQAGVTALEWDGKTGDEVIVADGVYFCYVEAPGSGGFNQTFKIAVKKE